MTEILIGKIVRPVFSRFATTCMLQPEHKSQVAESGMIITRMGSAID
jgi:hypothetical protein